MLSVTLASARRRCLGSISIKYATIQTCRSRVMHVPSFLAIGGFATRRLEIMRLGFGVSEKGWVGDLVIGVLNITDFDFFVASAGGFLGGSSDLYLRPCIFPRMATPSTHRMGRSLLHSRPAFRHLSQGIRDWSHRTCRFRHGQHSLDSLSSITGVTVVKGLPPSLGYIWSSFFPEREGDGDDWWSTVPLVSCILLRLLRKGSTLGPVL